MQGLRKGPQALEAHGETKRPYADLNTISNTARWSRSAYILLAALDLSKVAAQLTLDEAHLISTSMSRMDMGLEA